jgi:hypothetical protein
MGRPRKYSDNVRRIVLELALPGVGATEIARRLEAGEADSSLPAVHVPRTTVASILAEERKCTTSAGEILSENTIVLDAKWAAEEILDRMDEAGLDASYAIRWHDGEVRAVAPLIARMLFEMDAVEACGSALEAMERVGVGATTVFDHDLGGLRLCKLEHEVMRELLPEDSYPQVDRRASVG